MSGCAPGERGGLRPRRPLVTLGGRMDTMTTASALTRPTAGQIVVVLEALVLGLFLLLIL